MYTRLFHIHQFLGMFYETESISLRFFGRLRTISCLGIMMMHIQVNTNYNISGSIWLNVIPSFTWLVFLFLMISGFGMCAGYLQKFHSNVISLEDFYIRRYKKILDSVQ